MPFIRRLADYGTVVVLLFALFLRIYAAQKTWHGISGSRWSLYLTLAICFLRLAMILLDVSAGKAPWGRILFPALIILLLARVAAGTSSRLQGQIIGAALELALIAGAAAFVIFRWKRYRSVPHLEDVFEDIFFQFLPGNISRFAAREMVLLWEGLRFCFRGFRSVPAAGFGYVEQSYIKMLPLLIVIGLLTEGLAYELLAHNHPLLRLVMHVIEVWAVLWCFGMYATMKSRPHTISDQRVHLRCGVFSSCEFDPYLLLDVQQDDSYDLPPRKEVARMIVKGGPKLQVHLKEPVTVRRMMSGPQSFNRLMVSADDPAAFRQALINARRQTGRP